VLEGGRISATAGRGLHILSRLAQDGIICFGPRQAKQQTFVLLDEWVPAAKEVDREAALAKLAERYFTSHGPATLYDFVWWSGLTVADARAGLAMLGSRLLEERINGQSYWVGSAGLSAKQSTTAHLLPSYDEYTVGYKNRSALIDSAHVKVLDPVRSIFSPTILINGRIVGMWKRTFEKKLVVISPVLFSRLKPAEERGLSKVANQYGRFLGSQIALRTDS